MNCDDGKYRGASYFWIIEILPQIFMGLDVRESNRIFREVENAPCRENRWLELDLSQVGW